VRFADLVVPADFDFRATRPLKITLSAAASDRPGTRRKVELQRPDGAVLYRGSVTAAPVGLSFPVPLALRSLRVVSFDANGARTTETLPLPTEASSLHIVVGGP
jgi:hypothetical protein